MIREDEGDVSISVIADRDFCARGLAARKRPLLCAGNFAESYIIRGVGTHKFCGL